MPTNDKGINGCCRGPGWRHLDVDYDKREGADRKVFDLAGDGPRAWLRYAW